MHTAGSNGRGRSAGFTLVELLVVVGIIAVLVAILLPALNRARESANVASCLANLQQIGRGSMMHANEHQGYWPYTGYYNTTVPPVECSPTTLGDRSERRYTYFNCFGNRVPLPYMAAVAPYLGYKLNIDDQNALYARLDDPNGVRRVFTCPSQEQPAAKGTTIGSQGLAGLGGGFILPATYSSYTFNEGFLGAPYPYAPRLAGKAVKARRASEMVVMGDGKASGAQLWWTWGPSNPVTLADAFNNNYNAGNRDQFDIPRHGRRMNALFVDGHCETIVISTDGATAAGDLSRCYLMIPR